MKAAIVLIPLVLVACSAPTPPAPPAPPAPVQPAPPAPPATPVAATPAPADAMPLASFRALGTEPFWRLDVDGQAIVYATPDNQTGQTLSGTRTAVGEGVDIRGTHGGQPFVLRVRQGDCSDGMSDNRYPMTAEFEIGGELLKGCADRGK